MRVAASGGWATRSRPGRILAHYRSGDRDTVRFLREDEVRRRAPAPQAVVRQWISQL